MGLKYLCDSWQGFLQQLVTLVGHGYLYYCMIEYPEKKRSKWIDIDQKLIQKYDAGISKDQRYRRHKKGEANHIFLRWENCALILRTSGECRQGSDDNFIDIGIKSMIIKVGETLRLKIVPVGSRGACTVYIDKNVFRDLKAELLDHCRHRRCDILIKRFQALNGIPAYSGITQQMSGLVTDIIKAGRKHCLTLSRSDFSIRTSRKIYKVFS